MLTVYLLIFLFVFAGSDSRFKVLFYFRVSGLLLFFLYCRIRERNQPPLSAPRGSLSTTPLSCGDVDGSTHHHRSSNVYTFVYTYIMATTRAMSRTMARCRVAAAARRRRTLSAASSRLAASTPPPRLVAVDDRDRPSSAFVAFTAAFNGLSPLRSPKYEWMPPSVERTKPTKTDAVAHSSPSSSSSSSSFFATVSSEKSVAANAASGRCMYASASATAVVAGGTGGPSSAFEAFTAAFNDNRSTSTSKFFTTPSSSPFAKKSVAVALPLSSRLIPPPLAVFAPRDKSVVAAAPPFFRRCISTSAVTSAAVSSESYDGNGDHDSSAATYSSSDEDADVVPFLLADIGEGISEVELLRWYVAPSERVRQFDKVCEVQSDKATVEITSRYDGTIVELYGEEGSMMRVGEPLMRIATPVARQETAISTKEERTKATKEDQAKAADDERDRLRIPNAASDYSNYKYSNHEHDPAAVVDGNKRKVLTSPAVRKLTRDHGVDIGTVLGTGPGGRIMKSDVLKRIPSSPIGCGGDTLPSDSAERPSGEGSVVVDDDDDNDDVLPLRGLHRRMVQTMTSSLSVPRMVYSDEIRIDALHSIRAALGPADLRRRRGLGEEGHGASPKLTYLPFFIKAASLALEEYPVVNAFLDAEKLELTLRKRHDIGVAMDTERGLAVPVVRDCRNRSVLEIASELARLHASAVEGNLSDADIRNPTFTLSNIGALGGTYMSPVVLPPQVAIGAMGRIQCLPRFVDDECLKVEAARIMPVSWGADHRAVDGATMARFGNLWKYYCENPASMILAMR